MSWQCFCCWLLAGTYELALLAAGGSGGIFLFFSGFPSHPIHSSPASSARLLHTWAHPRFFFPSLPSSSLLASLLRDGLTNSYPCTIVGIPCKRQGGTAVAGRAGDRETAGKKEKPTVGWIRMASPPPPRPFPLGSRKEGPQMGDPFPGGAALVGRPFYLVVKL